MKPKSPEICRPLQAIRAFCMDCMGDDELWIAECEKKHCPMHPYRLGKNPNHTRDLSEGQKSELIARMGSSRRNAGSE